jgi:hypothetical protein
VDERAQRVVIVWPGGAEQKLRVFVADLFPLGKPRRAGAAEERIECVDALPACCAQDAARDGITAHYARRREENVSDEVEIHVIIE